MDNAYNHSIPSGRRSTTPNIANPPRVDLPYRKPAKPARHRRRSPSTQRLTVAEPRDNSPSDTRKTRYATKPPANAVRRAEEHAQIQIAEFAAQSMAIRAAKARHERATLRAKVRQAYLRARDGYVNDAGELVPSAGGAAMAELRLLAGALAEGQFDLKGAMATAARALQ